MTRSLTSTAAYDAKAMERVLNEAFIAVMGDVTTPERNIPSDPLDEAIAQSREGTKVHFFLTALKEGASFTEATEAAGISRQMGHTYLRNKTLTLGRLKK